MQRPLRFVVIALTAGVPYPELVVPCGCTKWTPGCRLVVTGSFDVQLSKSNEVHDDGIEIIDSDRFARRIAEVHGL